MTIKDFIETLEDMCDYMSDDSPVYFVDHMNIMHAIEVYSYDDKLVYIQTED